MSTQVIEREEHYRRRAAALRIARDGFEAIADRLGELLGEPSDPVQVEGVRRRERHWRACEAARERRNAQRRQESDRRTRGVVYFVRAGADGLIKIGKTKDLASRLRGLQRMSGVALHLLATLDGGMAKEAEMHRRFAHLRAHGEWFRPGPELLQFLSSVGEATPAP